MHIFATWSHWFMWALTPISDFVFDRLDPPWLNLVISWLIPVGLLLESIWGYLHYDVLHRSQDNASTQASNSHVKNLVIAVMAVWLRAISPTARMISSFLGWYLLLLLILGSAVRLVTRIRSTPTTSAP